MVRIPSAAGAEAERGRALATRDYALTVAPLLVADEDGHRVVLRVRSALTGQTLAVREATWRAAAGAPAPAAASGTVAARPAVRPAAVRPEPARPPRGPGLRPVEPARAIRRTEQTAGRATLRPSDLLNAIAVGDLDGDGRPEVVGVTEREVSSIGGPSAR